jgi:hypothetical protein
MGTLEFRTGAPDKARVFLQQAIGRERRLVVDGIGRTREKVAALVTKTGADVVALRSGLVPRSDHQDMELLELEGEIELLAELEENLRVIDGLEICP